MSSPGMLPLELLLENGHLTEIAASAIADGEEALLPPEVSQHAHSCPACSTLVQDQAMQSVVVGDLLRVAATEDAAVAAEPIAHAAAQPMPWASIALGSLLSIAGFVMFAIGSSWSFGDGLRNIRGLLVVLSRGGRALVRADLPPVVTFSSAAMLVALAIVVMRASPLAQKNRPASA